MSVFTFYSKRIFYRSPKCDIEATPHSSHRYHSDASRPVQSLHNKPAGLDQKEGIESTRIIESSNRSSPTMVSPSRAQGVTDVGIFGIPVSFGGDKLVA